MPPITILEKHDIPERLRRTFPSPKKLYVRGVMPDLSLYKCLAVVGARKFSPYGAQACRELIKGLKGYPFLIISGLAIGIDSLSHQAALDYGLPTIAIPGSGLNEEVLYPRSKRGLAQDIIKSGGCLLSEYAPDTQAQVWTFPQRNRLMAGLCDAVLIIEAEQKSGTLITARLALDYNKEVLAVSGSMFSKLSEGPHVLISQGAIPIRTSQDIVEAVGLVWNDKESSHDEVHNGHHCGSEETSPAHPALQTHNGAHCEQFDVAEMCTEQEKRLLGFLLQPRTRSEIIEEMNISIQELQIIISLLEIKGLIKEERGTLIYVQK